MIIYFFNLLAHCHFVDYVNSVLEAQIASFVSIDKRTISVHWPQIQSQYGSNDWFVFVGLCRNVACVCLGNDPCLFRYDQVRMRAHLMQCFIDGTITAFPREKRRAKLHVMKKHVVTLRVLVLWQVSMLICCLLICML